MAVEHQFQPNRGTLLLRSLDWRRGMAEMFGAEIPRRQSKLRKTDGPQVRLKLKLHRHEVGGLSS